LLAPHLPPLSCCCRAPTPAQFAVEYEALCEWDSVNIWDGLPSDDTFAGAVAADGGDTLLADLQLSGTGSLLKRTCGTPDGTEPPLLFVSSSNVLVVHLHSDESDVEEGFLVEFTAVPACGVAPAAGPGAVLAFDGAAPHTSPCGWVVTPTAPGEALAFTLHTLDLPCPHALNVHNGSSAAAPVVWSLCGDKPPGFTTPPLATESLFLSLPFLPFGVSMSAEVVVAERGLAPREALVEWPAMLSSTRVGFVCFPDAGASASFASGSAGVFSAVLKALSEDSTGAVAAAAGDVVRGVGVRPRLPAPCPPPNPTPPPSPASECVPPSLQQLALPQCVCLRAASTRMYRMPTATLTWWRS
jgi:hypothetical protein